MLSYLERLTQRLAWLRPASLVLALIGLAVVTFSLLVSSYQHLLIPGTLLLLWSLLAYSFLTLFRNLPPAQSSLGLLARIKNKLARGFYWLLACIFVFLSLGIFGITLRGLVIFFSG
ncbi:hypothetical protein SAMN05660443_0837 [Marinospirillum celere]|uniref:Uncharacterized protein n=1 Tax=Marinospirillum celere TaxID=1122252 RepID=A0A1I1ETK5_9GAMM|nr:hypothetical protein [Marinospirillum celere]SFB90337.1 hypothetical protein SAMN05660443_0837 [Marinospirillum celere]